MPYVGYDPNNSASGENRRERTRRLNSIRNNQTGPSVVPEQATAAAKNRRRVDTLKQRMASPDAFSRGSRPLGNSIKTYFDANRAARETWSQQQNTLNIRAQGN